MDRTTNHHTKRKLIVAGGIAALATVGAGTYSLALFTSSASVPNNTFGSGTVALSTDSPSSALLSFDNMLPGDFVTAPLVISNDGTGALRYSMTTKISDELKGLGSQLQLQIKTLGSSCTAFDGDLVYGNVDPTATSGSPAVEALDKPIADGAFGDSTAGKQDGDRLLAGSDNASPNAKGTANRADAASASAPSSETLCFRAYLPELATGNEFQGAAVTASFEFAAEQTANNP